MKKLLNKTLRTFSLYSLVVLAASVPAYYYLVDSIWLKELDEHNVILADRTIHELTALKLSKVELDESIELWNKLQPGTNLNRSNRIRPDSVYIVMRLNVYRTDNEIDRFRGLARYFTISGQSYVLHVETNVEETEETALAIALLTLIFFVLLVGGFLYFNRRLSISIWRPFRITLEKVKAFNLNNQQKVSFEKSNIVEFEELNEALTKLIDQNIIAYQIQKEFTENASHELQTPLAIIKNKLDLLLQSELLTDKQYQLIEEINKALTRTTRTNRNLLLLAKIENQQFGHIDIIFLDELLDHCVQDLREHIEQKSIVLHSKVLPGVVRHGNKALVEILLSNLLLNAIRHSKSQSEIEIELTSSTLDISNSGIDSLNTQNMFKRFARVSDATASSGLGLALIWEICHSHGWSIHYKFELGCHQFSVAF